MALRERNGTKWKYDYIDYYLDYFVCMCTLSGPFSYSAFKRKKIKENEKLKKTVEKWSDRLDKGLNMRER